MIPPLVGLTVTAHEPLHRVLLDKLLPRLESGPLSAAELAAERLPEFERLSVMPVRRLVPERSGSNFIQDLLATVTPQQFVPNLKSPAQGLSLLAGLYLIHDCLHEGHEMAQRAEQTGAKNSAPYWHGIMHRREPDYDNARYWFRRVGDHPIFPEIGREIGELLGEKQFAARLRFPRVLDRRSHWDAMAFIDLCEWCGTAWDDRAQAAARLQEVEMRLLLEYTCRAAQGAN